MARATSVEGMDRIFKVGTFLQTDGGVGESWIKRVETGECRASDRWLQVRGVIDRWVE